jgi:hypothetical protein
MATSPTVAGESLILHIIVREANGGHKHAILAQCRYSKTTSVASYQRPYAVRFALDPSQHMQQIFLAMKRIIVRPRPSWNRATDRLIMVEGRFQYSLTMRQPRHLLL